jgi:anti-anti-sigma factor
VNLTPGREPDAGRDAAAVNTLQVARLRRASLRVVPRWYEFQELALTLDGLWADFHARCRRYRLPQPNFEPSERPLYSFAVNRGIVRMVCRPPVTGAAKSETVEFWTEAVPEASVLHVGGEIDFVTAPQFARALAAALRKADRLIVDLAGLRYMDGSGVRVLLDAAERGEKRFVLVESTPTVHRVLDILRVGDVLTIVPTLETARQHFRTR